MTYKMVSKLNVEFCEQGLTMIVLVLKIGLHKLYCFQVHLVITQVTPLKAVGPGACAHKESIFIPPDLGGFIHEDGNHVQCATGKLPSGKLT